MRLFHRFLIALLAVSLLPLAGFTIITFFTAAGALKASIDGNTAALTDTVLREVNIFLSQLDDKLTAGRSLERHDCPDPSARSRFLFNALASDRSLLDIALLDHSFAVQTSFQRSGSSPFSCDQALLGEAGRSGAPEPGAIRTGHNQEPYVDIVFPVDGKQRQYLYFRFDLQRLSDQLAALIPEGDSGAGVRILLLDRYGGGIAVSREKGRDRRISLPPEIYEKHEPQKPFVHRGMMTIVNRSLGPGWRVVYEQPASSAYAPLYRMYAGLGALTAAAFIICFFFARWLSRQLVRPIENVIAGMEVVSEGNLEHHIPDTPIRELSRQTAIFNKMTGRLKELQTETKKKERLATMGQMTGVLAHEIRNPLSTIANGLYLLKRMVAQLPGADAFSGPIALIDREVRSCNKLTEDMLSFSRTRPPMLTRQSVSMLVRDIVQSMVLPDAIQYELLSKDEGESLIDAEEMKQVLRNLVNNAVDSMQSSEKGLLTVSITLSDDGDTVVLSISDTGCGIPPGDLERIFEPFYSTKSRGTGLGLSVVKRIVEERHGGTIAVKSAAGSGTTVTVRLPAA